MSESRGKAAAGRRRVLGILALLTVATFVGFGTTWKHWAARWYVQQLRRDPAELSVCLEAERQLDWKLDAIRTYAGESQGAAELLALYLRLLTERASVFFDVEGGLGPENFAGDSRVVFSYAGKSLLIESVGGGALPNVSMPIGEAPRLQRLQEWLPWVRPGAHTVPWLEWLHAEAQPAWRALDADEASFRSRWGDRYAVVIRAASSSTDSR